MTKNILRESASSVLILSGSGLLIALCLAPFGDTPGEGVSLLIQGAFGSLRRLSETCVKTSPLLFTGLAVALAFRAGAFNIGAEGQFLLGAMGAAAVGAMVNSLPGWLAVSLSLLAAVGAGCLWGGIAGALKAWRGIPEVISTIMLNFIALYWLSALVRGPLKESSSGLPESAPIGLASHLPRLFEGYRVHLGLPIAILLAVLLHLLLAKTTWGFKMRAVGLNPAASIYSGYSSHRIWALTLALSGALAGLGGGVEVCGITFRVYDNYSPGYGYTAIAVALLARLNMIAVIPTAFFFGALEQGAGTLQRELDVPLVMVSVVQGLVILLALLVEFKTSGFQAEPIEGEAA